MASSSKAPATSTPEPPEIYVSRHLSNIRLGFRVALEASIITLAARVEDTARKQGYTPWNSFSVVQQDKYKNSPVLPCLFVTGYDVLKRIIDGLLIATAYIPSIERWKGWIAERPIPGIYVLEIMNPNSTRLSPRSWTKIVRSMETYINPILMTESEALRLSRDPQREAAHLLAMREVHDEPTDSMYIGRLDGRFGPSQYSQKYIRDGYGQDINPEKVRAIKEFCESFHLFVAPLKNTDLWDKPLYLNVLEVGYTAMPTRRTAPENTVHLASHYLTQLIEVIATWRYSMVLQGTFVMPVYRVDQIEPARSFIGTLSQARVIFQRPFASMTGRASGEHTPALVLNAKRAIFGDVDVGTMTTWNREVAKLEDSDDLKNTLINLKREAQEEDHSGGLEYLPSKPTLSDTEREDRGKRPVDG